MEKVIVVAYFTLLFALFRCFMHTKWCHNNISGSIANCEPGSVATKTGYQKDTLL